MTVRRAGPSDLDALAALPVPTLARLHGGVHGGAVDLALACDFRVGDAGLQLRMPAARIGLHYYPGGLRRAVSRLGLAAAKRLFLLAEVLDAAQLRELGYLDVVVATEALDAEVERMAAALLGGAPLALSGMKRSLDEIAAGTADAAVRCQGGWVPPHCTTHSVWRCQPCMSTHSSATPPAQFAAIIPY